MLGMIAGKVKSIQQAGAEALKSLGELEGKMNLVPNWSETHKAAMRHHRQCLEKLLNTAQYFRLSEVEEKDDGTRA